MSTELICDLCGKVIGTERGRLLIFEFNDGYNTDTYDSHVDICEKCLNEKIGKDVIMKGRTF